MKVIPRPYYKCDYCDSRSDYENGLKYTDNSGLNNKCYDMCSDECYAKHLSFLRNEVYAPNSRYEFATDNYPLKQYIEDHIWHNRKNI